MKGGGGRSRKNTLYQNIQSFFRSHGAGRGRGGAQDTPRPSTRGQGQRLPYASACIPLPRVLYSWPLCAAVALGRRRRLGAEPTKRLHTSPRGQCDPTTGAQQPTKRHGHKTATRPAARRTHGKHHPRGRQGEGTAQGPRRFGRLRFWAHTTIARPSHGRAGSRRDAPPLRGGKGPTGGMQLYIAPHSPQPRSYRTAGLAAGSCRPVGTRYAWCPINRTATIKKAGEELSPPALP